MSLLISDLLLAWDDMDCPRALSSLEDASDDRDPGDDASMEEEEWEAELPLPICGHSPQPLATGSRGCLMAEHRRDQNHSCKSTLV